MRKFIILTLAILFTAGIAYGHTVAIDPKTGAPSVTIPVYNNSSSTIDAGDVVIWDIDDSTGDNDAYVNTTTTASTGMIAGVVYPADIGAASVGSILIYGVTSCDIVAAAGVIAVDAPLCTSGTAGAGTQCELTEPTYAHTVTATTSGGTTVNCFVNVQ